MKNIYLLCLLTGILFNNIRAMSDFENEDEILDIAQRTEDLKNKALKLDPQDHVEASKIAYDYQQIRTKIAHSDNLALARLKSNIIAEHDRHSATSNSTKYKQPSSSSNQNTLPQAKDLNKSKLLSFKQISIIGLSTIFLAVVYKYFLEKNIYKQTDIK